MQKYNRIIFSDHCLTRQSERDVTRQQILKCLEEPINELPVNRKSRRKFWKKIDGSKLIVILKEVQNGKEAIIVTTYWRD
jgi:hypothetical protein